ncbi:putative reverse transcriptase domain-containing protein [Tanacetum coccineum]|uniref:Reverse transcriptase domain-containing protein n=1 Tax=Tanacetum coccineum TaxID=301880 RepID=A0ABQ5BG14_9ASTR
MVRQQAGQHFGSSPLAALSTRGRTWETLGIDWLSNHKAKIIYHEKVVRIPLLDGKVLGVLRERLKEKARHLMIVKAKEQKQEEMVVVRDFPKFLDHVINRDGIHVDTSKVEAVKNWEAPKTPSEGEEQERAFQTLKDKLCNAPVLAFLDRPKDFVVYYDASGLGLGCVLMQIGRLIAYASRQLKIYEKNYITYDLELGAVVFALKIWRHYLYRIKSIELFSDYDFEIHFHPGKANVVADALSRKERIKPKRVRAVNMTLHSNIKDRILVAQKEASDEHKKCNEGVMRTLIMDEAQKLKYYVYSGPDKMYYDLRDMYWWPGIKKDIAVYDYKMDRLARLYLNEIVSRHDKRRKPLEFSVGEFVLFKVSPWKGVVHFGKKGKLAPRFVEPFEITKQIGLVAYRLRLPEELNVDVKLNFVEEPVEILEREFKKLKQSRIAIVKVWWNLKCGPEFMWEREDQMRLNLHDDLELTTAKEVIENGNAPPITKVVEGVETIIAPITAEEKAQKSQLAVLASIKDAKRSLLHELTKRLEGMLLLKRLKSNLLKQQLVKILVALAQREVKGTSSSNTNTQNVAFVSSNTTGSTNGAVNTAHGATTVSTQTTTINSTTIDNLSNAVICAYFASQPNSPQLDNEDLQQIHPNDLKKMDLRWQMAMLTMRGSKEPKNGNRKTTRRVVLVETTTSNALISCDGAGYDWSDQAEEGPTNFALMAYTSTCSNSDASTDSNCSSSYLENVKILKEQNEQLLNDLRISKLHAIAYKTGLESVEARLLVYKKNKSVYEEDIKIVDKCKTGLGYNAVPPPYIGDFMPPKSDLSFFGLEEFVNEPIVSEPIVEKPVVETSEAKASTDKPKAVKKNNGAPIIEDWVSDSEEEDMPQAKIQKKTVKLSFAKIELVKSKEQVKNS